MKHSKKLLTSMTASAIFLTSLTAPAAFAAESKDVPVRKTIENMEGKITWNDKDRSIQIDVGSVQALLKLDSEDATLQGKSIKLNKKPYLLDQMAQISPETLLSIQQLVIAAQNKTGYEVAATFKMPNGKAEIISSTPDGKRLVVTEDDLGSVSILNIEDVTKVTILKTVSLKSLSDKVAVTSVAVTTDGKYALAAVRTGDDKNTASKGIVAVIDLTTYAVAKTYEVGIGPDSIVLSKDGKYAVVAIEDEEIDIAKDEIDYKNAKRPGSIAVISFAGGDATQGELTDIKVDLTAVKGAIYPHDPQPEYIAISPDSLTAAITLQENNAIAMVDLSKKAITSIFALGVTKHKADLKTDDKVSITEDLTSRPEPDGIAFTSDGKYLFTANEGDLGKDEFKDGVRSGGRNVMGWDLNGNVVYDSMEWIDHSAALAGLYPEDRSGNRGSEVENLTIAEVGGKQIMAVAAERANAIVFFDVTNPLKPVHLGLLPSGTSPEGIIKVTGRNLFISADEVAGSLTFYQGK
ncbi:choice-of-anchor I domain-containing protein [Paenibacillus agricola]|uniref:YncE family protein n=1 Tax=Paenibacillus agricola TaxID=2716264 RepID=A0ABX0IYD3_9BACL|nr:stalk domain-containing protein [Paenibacillus agricola]NHN28970.1 YncE family protein [Paenibacillus agricola]